MKTNMQRDPFGALIAILAFVCFAIGSALLLVPSCGMLSPSRHHPVTTDQRILP